MTIETELEETIDLLEARIPANPNTAKNERKAKTMERLMRRYFKALEQAFPYDAIEQLYYKYVKPD